MAPGACSAPKLCTGTLGGISPVQTQHTIPTAGTAHGRDPPAHAAIYLQMMQYHPEEATAL